MNRYGTATVTLPSDRELVITRAFDAPAHLVFDVWTTPKHVRRWWSAETAPLVVCDIDLRVDGRWRYVTRDGDGTELGWNGVYREIVSGERIVATEVFEGYPDAEALNTLTLTEADWVTILTVNVLHKNKENRDGHINSGMETGLQLALNRLEDLVATQPVDQHERAKEHTS